MAVISVPSSIQGQSYTVRIAGDTPTPQEQARIDAYVSQMDARLAAPAPTAGAVPPEEPSTLSEIGSGLGRGFLGTLAAAPGGIGALLEAGYGKLSGEPITPGSTAFGGVLQDISEGAQAGVEDIFGPASETTAGKISEAFGSIGSFLLPGGIFGAGARALGAGVRAAGMLSTAAGAGMGAALGAGQQAQDIGDAILNGDIVDPDAQQAAILWGGLIGTSEVVAGGAVSKLLGTTYKILNKVPPSMKEEAIATISGRIRSAITTGGIEGAQEALSQIGQNIVAREYYDEGRDITEGAGESLGLGGAAGAAIDLALTSARAPAVRRSIQQRQAKEEADALAEIEADQKEDAQKILDQINFGLAAEKEAAKPVVEPEAPPAIAGLLPKPSAPAAPAAPKAAEAPAAEAPVLEKRKPVPFRWRQYTSAMQNVINSGDASIPSIQKAASLDGKKGADPATAKDIRAQLVNDGLIVADKKAKGGYRVVTTQPNFDAAESYRRTLDDLRADTEEANMAKEKAIQDARRAAQTGTKADAKKFMLAIEKAQSDINRAQQTTAEVQARLDQVQREGVVPTAERPGSRVAEGKAVVPAPIAPEATKPPAKAVSAQAEKAPRTASYTAKQGELFTALRNRLNGLGLDDVKLVADRMIRPKGAPEGTLVEGMMDVDSRNGNRIIALAMNIYDPKMSDKELFDAISEVMDHEVIHALRSLGLFKDAEWKTLTDLAARQGYMRAKGGKVVQRKYTYLQRARQMYPNDTPEVQLEEAVAEMFRDYVAGRLKIGGRPRSLMERIKNFFRSIWKSHEDVGFTDVNAIFEGVRLGKVGGRERALAPVTPSRMSVTATNQLPAGVAAEEEVRDPRDIVMPIDPTAPVDQIKAQISALTQENIPIIRSLLADVDRTFGTKSNDSVKDLDKVIQKATRPSILYKKPWHNVSHIRDTYRFQTQIDDIMQAPAIFQRLLDAGVTIVKIDTNKLFNPTEWGWRIIAFDLRMPNGQLVEYQLPLKEMLKQKKGIGHKIYEKWRSKSQAELLAEYDEYQKDMIDSFEGYNEAFNASLERIGLTPQEAEEAWSNAESSLLDAARNSRSSSGVMTSSSVSGRDFQTPSNVRITPLPSSFTSQTRGVPSSISANGRFGIDDTSVEIVSDKSVEDNLTPQQRAAVRYSLGRAVANIVRNGEPNMRPLPAPIKTKDGKPTSLYGSIFEGNRPIPVIFPEGSHSEENRAGHGMAHIVARNHHNELFENSKYQSVQKAAYDLLYKWGQQGHKNGDSIIAYSGGDNLTLDWLHNVPLKSLPLRLVLGRHNVNGADIYSVKTFFPIMPKAGAKRYSMLNAGPSLTGEQDGLEDVGRSPAGEAGYDTPASRAAGKPAAPDIAPRTEDGGTDLRGLTTSDLDNITPAFFNKPGWAIITATQTDQSDRLNEIAHRNLKGDLEYMKIPYREVYGVYEGKPDGVSYIILADEPTAMRLGMQYDQDSVLTSRGFLYTSRPMPRTIRGENIFYGEEATSKDFYSQMEDGTAFSLELMSGESGPAVADIGPGYYTLPNRPQLPIRAVDGKVELHHWSTKELDNVDPAMAGTGPLQGIERRRGAKLGFFGINPRPDERAQGTGYVKESEKLGKFEHIALVDPESIYPYFTDPDGLSAGLNKADPNFISNYESRIREAGYDGYYTERIYDNEGPMAPVRPADAPIGNVAAMFVRTPVKPIEQVQLGLKNPVRYSMRRGMKAPLTKAERSLTVLDRMDPISGIFISDGKRRDVVQAITDLNAPRSTIVIMPEDADSVTRVARLMLAELRMALVRNPEAIGWYGTTLAKAKRVAAVLHPEISPVNPYSGAKSNSYDPNAEHAWDLAMAITSNGMAVSENAKFANEQYEFWKNNGRFMEEGTGDQGSGMVAAFRAYNIMKESMTDAQIADFLSQKMTVKELRNNPIIRELGISVGTNEGANTVVNGSYIFGPKIGQGFYQNLRGNFDPLTMDLWFMRMFNRLTGRPFRDVPEKTLYANAARVAENANRDDLSEYDQRVKRAAMAAEDIDVVTTENADRFAVAFDKIYQRDFKKFYDDAIKSSGLDPKSKQAKEIGKAARPAGSELVLSSKRYRENLSLVPEDAPRGAGDRSYMRAVVDEVRAALANEGNFITTADIQAVMWYAEKQLFSAMGVRGGKGADNDYVDGAIELLRSKGVDDAEIARSLPAAERDRLRYRTAAERAAARLRAEPEAEDQVEGGGGVGDVQAAPVRSGTTAAARDGDRRLAKRLSVRYATTSITPKVAQKIQANQKTLMYARSADVIARILGTGGIINKDDAKRFTDGLLRRFQDSMLPVGRMVQELSTKGMTITDAMDPYLQEELMHGVVGQRVGENQKVLYTPVVEAIKKLNVPKARIDQLVSLSNAAAGGRGYVGLALEQSDSPRTVLADAYLYAKHAKERNRYIKANKDKTNDSGSGMKDAEADVILQWFESLDPVNKKAIQDVARGIRAIVADTNATRVDAGLISPDVEDPYKFYVPLRGITNEDTNVGEEEFSGVPGTPRFGARGREDRKTLGRYEYASDIVANVFTQNQNAILRGERNKVGQSVLELFRADPVATKSYGEVLKKAPTIRASVDGKIRDVPDPRAYNDPDILVVKEGGKETYIRFTDNRIAGALNGKNGMSPTNGNVVVSAMQTLNRYLASINTSYNPEFFITNMFRDLQTAGVNVNQYEIEGLTGDVMSNLKSALTGIKRVIRNEDDTSQWSKVYKDFMAAGGQNATNQFNSLSEEMANIQTLLGDISESGARGQWAKVKNSFVGQKAGSLLQFIEDYNTVVENGIRVAAYKALLDRGFTRERAAQAARNVTVNFAKGGDYRQFMNAWSLFYNASLQGSFAMLNAATRSSKVRRVWAGVMVAGLLQDQLNALLSDEDEDGQKIYDKVPDYILEHNFILPDPFGITDRSYISIPMPYGLNMAHNIGRAVSRAMRGEYDPGQATSTIVGTIIDTINPIGGTESWANFVAPTIADPFVDILENEDFADKPIYKEGLPFDRTPSPDSQLYWATTSPSAIWIAKTLNELTGGNEVRPGFIDWSPDILEYWFNFATGGVGRFIQNTVESPVTAFQEGFSEELMRSVPFVRKLIGSVSEREDMGTYMEGAKSILTIGEELKRARETGDMEWAQDIVRENPVAIRLIGPIKSIESGLREISKRRNKIMASTQIPEGQKQLLLDQLDARKQALLARANALLRQAGV